MLKLVDGGLGNLPVRRITAWAALRSHLKTRYTFREITIPTHTDPFWNNPPPATPRTSTTLPLP